MEKVTGQLIIDNNKRECFDNAPKNYTHWQVKYTSGAVAWLRIKEDAKSEALSNENVIGIKAPLFDE